MTSQVEHIEERKGMSVEGMKAKMEGKIREKRPPSIGKRERTP